ncbi:MAG: trehalose-6-phosphate synthase, partial [Chloroflexi bacterium]|nr:trehalose-6-phosphate synthase [Chloroflexota bacterium]
NREFANAIVDEARGSGLRPLVMVHDYHLYLVPGYVRQELPEATIQHYLHIPWPGPSYWQLLPSHMCRSICESLCSADVVGFQTVRDAQSFLATCSLFLPKAEVDFSGGVVNFNGHKTATHAYPLSIDVEEIRRIAISPRASEYKQRLMPLCAEKTIVRVDRAEPNKNIVRGFRAYEHLLERYPELHGKVTFLAFLVPSRTHIRQYQRYLDEIQQVANDINGNYGSSDWQPVHLFLENNYTQAIAALCQYDVLLINAVIDGMNLIAKEGPVVNAKNGVLVLTETVGAYQQLAEGALSVAPTDVEGTTEALYEALTMSEEERAKRQAVLVEAIEREDLLHWLQQQFQDIRGVA